MSNAYSGILTTFVVKPIQQTLEDLLEHELIQNKSITDATILDPILVQSPILKTMLDEPTIIISIKKSTRQRCPAIFYDYYVYLGEFDYIIGQMVDILNFKEAISCPYSNKWFEAMKEEIQSMSDIGV